jgi:hypothetical protein
MSTHINLSDHPVGSRLLVAFKILNTNPNPKSYVFPPPAFNWEESDQLCEVKILEYSPSKEHVLVSSTGDSSCLNRVGGWYPVYRIVVKEILPKQLKTKKGKQ